MPDLNLEPNKPSGLTTGSRGERSTSVSPRLLGGPTAETRFTSFVYEVEPRLRRALVATLGQDATHDAVAEALTYAWEHWHRVESMQNPAGYLYRVARSRVRERRPATIKFLVPDEARLPEVEPGLVGALESLSPQQRAAVWLVHGCEWSYQETAEALDISASAVGTHVARGLDKLRSRIGGLS